MNGNVLIEFAAWLAPHLPLALVAVSVLLAIGGTALVFARSPAHRQRIGELTLAAALGWLILAAIPLPRWLPADDAPDAGMSQIGPNGASFGHVRAQVGASWRETEARATTSQNSTPESAIDRRLVGPVDPTHAPSSPIVAPTISTNELFSHDGGIATTPQAVTEVPLVVETTAIDSKADDVKLASGGTAQSLISSILRPNEIEDRGANRWLRAAACAYLIGVALAAFWLLFGHALLIRERFTAASPPAWLYRMLHIAVSQWRGRLPRLIVSRRSSRPLSWGIWRPIICLPERICHTANRDQLRTILLHELGHNRRSDARGNLLFELAFPVLFFHPLYWWLRSQVRMAAELVADDWAARQTGKENYVAQLVALARGSGRRRLLLAGTGVFSSPSQFYRRMQMLLARENPLITRPSKFWRIASMAGFAAAVALGAALAGNRPAAGQQTDQPAKEPPKPAASDLPKTEPPAAPTPTTAEAPKPATTPVAIQPSAPASTGSLPAAKDVPATSAPAATAPIATTPVAAGPSALASDTDTVNAGLASDDAVTAARLQAEKAKLLDEIQALRAKLHAIEATKTGTGGVTAYPAALQPGEEVMLSADRLMILSRVDEKGHLFEEVWTTDENGRPLRIVKRTMKTGESPIAAAAAGVSDGNRVVKMFKDKDGRIWVHTYDPKSGKLIESKETTYATGTPVVVEGTVDPTQDNPAPKGIQVPDTATGRAGSGLPKLPHTSLPAGKYPPSVHVPGDAPSPDVTVWEAGKGHSGPVMIARSSDGAPANVSDRPIDLITLATSYADAVGAVEMAKAKLKEADSAGQPGELLSRRAALESAARKEKLLRRIAEVATNGAKQNYERLVKLHGQGAVSAEMLEESKSRLDILSQILDTRRDTTPDGGAPQPK
jgi:beta-lactamase regulating signal transducer with metallopeptidase domain